MKDMPEGELRARLALGEVLIQQIADDPDPRRDAAIANLREQMAQIRAALARRAPIGPHDVVIAMDSLAISGKLGDTGDEHGTG